MGLCLCCSSGWTEKGISLKNPNLSFQCPISMIQRSKSTPNRRDGAPKLPWEIPRPPCCTQVAFLAKLLPKLIKQKGNDQRELNPGQSGSSTETLEKALGASTARFLSHNPGIFENSESISMDHRK